MIPTQYEPLLSKLEIATSTISGLWDKTSDKQKFSVSINGITVIIHKYVIYPENAECVSFEIMDPLGDVIDGIYYDESEAEYNRVNLLYESARRNALKISETLSDVVSGLDELLSKNATDDDPDLPF
ncbi:MAG: hypothetical protein K2K25_00885 [Muribaculaceae bacterium]|nr:hypothetical protein [Muribaculaceae bacterium]